MLDEPFLSQEREIEELIKFHENEIKKLKVSLSDIYFNSAIDFSVPIPRKVYGVYEPVMGLDLGAIQDFPQDVQETMLTGKEWRNNKAKKITEGENYKINLDTGTLTLKHPCLSDNDIQAENLVKTISIDEWNSLQMDLKVMQGQVTSLTSAIQNINYKEEK